MSGKKHKKLRKETQLVGRQAKQITQQVMVRMTLQPFKTRLRLAWMIIRGAKKNAQKEK